MHVIPPLLAFLVSRTPLSPFPAFPQALGALPERWSDCLVVDMLQLPWGREGGITVSSYSTGIRSIARLCYLVKQDAGKQCWPTCKAAWKQARGDESGP